MDGTAEERSSFRCDVHSTCYNLKGSGITRCLKQGSVMLKWVQKHVRKVGVFGIEVEIRPPAEEDNPKTVRRRKKLVSGQTQSPRIAPAANVDNEPNGAGLGVGSRVIEIGFQHGSMAQKVDSVITETPMKPHEIAKKAKLQTANPVQFVKKHCEYWIKAGLFYGTVDGRYYRLNHGPQPGNAG